MKSRNLIPGLTFRGAFLFATLALVPVLTDAAPSPDQSLESLDNQDTSVVSSVQSDQTVEESAVVIGYSFYSDISGTEWPKYTVFQPFPSSQFSSLQSNFGYATDPNQNGSKAAASFINVTATLLQIQNPALSNNEQGIQFLLADIGTVKDFLGNPSATNKYSNKAQALFKEKIGDWTPSIAPIYTYSYLGSGDDSKPELRATIASRPYSVDDRKRMEFKVTPFVDRLKDFKPVTGAASPHSADSNQWSAGGTLSLSATPPSPKVPPAWKVDDTFGVIRNLSEGVTQSYRGFQNILAIKTISLGNFSGLVSFEYDDNQYDSIQPTARSSKWILSAQLDYKLTQKSVAGENEAHLLFGVNPSSQAVDNPLPTRKLKGFSDNEFFVAIQIFNGSPSYSKQLKTLEKLQFAQPN
jgi:hypothetical protein